MLLVTRELKVGKITLAELTTVYAKSYFLR